ncbi:MAG: DHA2 family efflux MFS transporter permease subunit [Muribaculaceae bacterium]|nr:DHA2 family efflux MFS transporter permease subunit [Muribaculaceae bacterium]
MSDNESWKPSINPWLMIIPVILAAFICILDTTVGNVALPHMAGAFSASRDESMWILTSYLVAAGIVMPAVDWLGKVFGRKNYFILSILVFTGASMLCGLAQNIEFMIFARILQGLGGGGLVPVANAIIWESFSKEERGAALSVFGMGVVIAPIIGPVLGGWITDNWSWPWIFYINVPLGCLAVFLAKNLIQDPPWAEKQKNVTIDKIGFLFLTIWLCTFQIVLDKGNDADWFNSAWVCWTFAISMVACGLFFYSQFKNKDSLIDLTVFKDRNFTSGVIVQFVAQAILYSSLAIVPQFLQNMLGYTAYLSGTTIATRGMGSVIALITTAKLSNKVDNRIFVAVGLILIGISGLMFGNFNFQINPSVFLIPNVILGVGVGWALVPIMTLTVATLKKEQMTNASAIQNLLKNVAGAIGTSLVSTLVTRFSQVHQFMLVHNLSDLNPVYNLKLQHLAANFSHLPDAVAKQMAQRLIYKELLQQATMFGYIDAFRFFGILAFFMVPLLLLIKVKKESI